MAYQYYSQGSFLSLEGRLGKDIVIENTSKGSRFIKLSIAVNAGQTKDQSGNWNSLTNWYTITIWEKEGNAKLLFDAIEKSGDKVWFAKGNLVNFKGMVTVNSRVYNEKAYTEFTVINFYDLTKPIPSATTGTKEEKREDTSSSPLDDF